jgi:hypothetical protein
MQVLVEILNAKEMNEQQPGQSTVQRAWRGLPAERLFEMVYQLGGTVQPDEVLAFRPNEIVLCREGAGRLWAVARWGVPATH